MVSSFDEQPSDVQLVRIICADPNPEGPGIMQQEIESTINGSYPSRVQPFQPSSYRRIERGAAFGGDGSFTLSANIFPTLPGDTEQAILSVGNANLLIAEDGSLAGRHFNEKIEAPEIFCGAEPRHRTLWASWDFSRCISSSRIEDIGPNALHGELINLPTRAVTGSNWTGEEMCWRHAPEQYGAIHFHDDDIYDFNWEPDFELEIPEDLTSGVYAARIRCGGFEDAMPFFVCPPKSKRKAELCVLVSTFIYVIHGNHARPDFVPEWNARIKAWNAYPWNPAQYRQYGLSTYNTHSDWSGICHASHRRPLFNLRPGNLTFGYGEGPGLRHFQADSHLIAWLYAKGHEFDIITDQELHDEGFDAIFGYKALTTGTHPEYHTKQTLNALETYRDQSGRLIYLEGNGFYWRIAVHKEEPGALENRRA